MAGYCCIAATTPAVSAAGVSATSKIVVVATRSDAGRNNRGSRPHK